MLTLLFFATFPIHALSSNSEGLTYPVNSARAYDAYNNAIDADAQSQQRAALFKYIRAQGLNWAPGLPDELRSSARWVLGGFHNTTGLFNFNVSSMDTDKVAEALNDPIAHFNQPLSPEEKAAPWMASTSYHHRNGILPTRDAMIVGTHVKQAFLDNYMGLDAHPYYGQNYFSTNGYYGGEMQLDLKAPSAGADPKPWGTISVGYTNGDGALTDHGRGIDLHGAVHFDDELSLNSGIRQNDTTGSGNYVLLQWKLAIE